MNKTEFDYLREIRIKRRTYFLVKKDQRIGLLRENHKIQIPVEWDELEINDHFCLKDFLEIPAFYSMYNQRNETAVVIFAKRRQKWGIIDLYGHEIIPVSYDRIEIVGFAGRCYFKVSANGKEGLVCFNGNVLIPVKWDRLLPVSFSNRGSGPQFLWSRQADGLFCFEASGNLEKVAETKVAAAKQAFQFVIYNRYFELVTPEVLDGYATITPSYLFTKNFAHWDYILIRKETQYGVLSHDLRLISKPVLPFQEALSLIRKQQQKDYIEYLINYLKDQCKEINKYIEQHQKAKPTDGLPTQEVKDERLTNQREQITKDEIKKIATVLGQRLTDLKAFRLAAWAEHMEAQIEKEDHQETLAIIGDLLEWLQSLRLNPELTCENKPVIEKGDDQELQPDYNQGFAEMVLNREIEFPGREEGLK